MKEFRTCCFIDHHSQNYLIELGDKNLNFIKLKANLEKFIINLIESYSVTHFISGMELGLEQLFAEIVIELKTKFPEITLEGVIPHENQVTNWSEDQRDKYYSIMQKIDKEMLLQYHYSHDCMRKRNLYMINKSKYIILYTNKTSKKDTINRYARSSGKIVYVMNGNNLNIIPHLKICR